MLNPKTIPVIVDGMEFAIIWMDYGSFMRLRVFRNDKVLGYKDFPLTTDTGQGVIEYTVRSLVKGVNNEHSSKAFETETVAGT